MTSRHRQPASTRPGAEAPRRSPSPARVLVLRSARMPQFERALAVARKRNPDATVVALSHVGHREALLAAGVDEVVEIPGRRFALQATTPRTWQRLRALACTEIVVPQMSAYPDQHRSLHWFVAAFRSERIVLVPDGGEPEVRDRARFALQIARDVLRSHHPIWDVLAFLALLVVALCGSLRRMRRQPGPDRLRILHIVSSLQVGGAQRQLATLLNALPADRYDVDVLVFHRGGHETARRWLQRDDVRITYLTLWPQLSIATLDAMLHCRAGGYHIVHTWLFWGNVIGVAAARLAGAARVVMSVRSLSPRHLPEPTPWWMRPADVLASHAADAITVNARALQRDHVRWALVPRWRIDVVHNGLDPSLLRADRGDARRRLIELGALPADAIVVGTAGRLSAEKDHRLFLQLLRAARETDRRIHGVIIGDGRLRSELEDTAALLGLDAAVTFLGERHDAVCLMAGLDLFVLPSRVEGFPNVLLEAALLGIPAVATAVGGTPDVLPEPAALFPVGDPAAGTRAVLRMLDDRAAAVAQAARCREHALAHFTAQHTVAVWQAIYDRLLPAAVRADQATHPPETLGYLRERRPIEETIR